MKRKLRLNSLYAKEIAAVVLLLALTLFMTSYGDFVKTGYAVSDTPVKIAEISSVNFETKPKFIIEDAGTSKKMIVRATNSHATIFDENVYLSSTNPLDVWKFSIGRNTYELPPSNYVTELNYDIDGDGDLDLIKVEGTKSFWNVNAYLNAPTTCSDRTTREICGRDSACEWNAGTSRCAGKLTTPITSKPCSQLTVAACNTQYARCSVVSEACADKASAAVSDTTPPVITDYGPKADELRRARQNVVSVIINVTTGEPAVCRHSASGSYETSMALYHEWTLRLEAGAKKYNVECKDAAGNAKSQEIAFNLQITNPDSNACGGTEPAGAGVFKGVPAYSGSTPVSWSPDESATATSVCKWKCIEGFRQSGDVCERIVAVGDLIVTATVPQSVSTSSVDVDVQTTVDARCKISVQNYAPAAAYNDVLSAVTESQLGKAHKFSLSSLRNKQHTYYVYCIQPGLPAMARASVSFTVNAPSDSGVTSESQLNGEFGVPWNVFSSDRQWAIKVTPNPAQKTGNKVRITVEARGDYVRRDFYIFDYATMAWKKYFLNGQILERNNNWLVGPGRKELELSSGMLTAGKNYIASATCSQDSSGKLWCGCRTATNCNKWQLQTFTVNAVLPRESINTDQLVEYLQASSPGTRTLIRTGICTECVFPSTTPSRADFDSSGRVDFNDFFMFSDAFGTGTGEAGFAAKFDINNNGKVDFNDFFAFADQFGKTVSGTFTCGDTAPAGSGKVIGASTYTGGYDTPSWIYADDATTSTPCKWKCAAGFTRDPANANSCIAAAGSTNAFIGGTGSGNGQFGTPFGISIDTSGNIYVVDVNNNRIQKFDSNGNFITKWGTQGTANGQFNHPWGIAIDTSNNIYVTDPFNNRIQKFDSNGNFLLKWGTQGSDNGQVNIPIGIAVDTSGNVYVGDRFNYRIQKFDSNGNFITKWGTQGTANGQFSGGDDGIFGIAVDTSGNVYVAENANNRIQKFDSNGNFLTKLESRRPNGLSVDTSGNVYVTNTALSKVQKFDSNGNLLLEQQHDQVLYGITIDKSGNIYVTNSIGDKIQKLTLGTQLYSSVVVDAGTISEYSTMTGRVTAASLGLITGGTVTTVSGTSTVYNTYIDLTSPQTTDYELTYDNMRGQITRQLNFGPLPEVASGTTYFYRDIVEFQNPVAPSEMPGMVLNLFGTDYTVLSASASSVSLLKAADAEKNKNFEEFEVNVGGQNYMIIPTDIQSAYADIRVKKKGAAGYSASAYGNMHELVQISEGKNSYSVNSGEFKKFVGEGDEIYIGVYGITWASEYENRRFGVVVGKDKVDITENSATSNPGYFVDIETDSQGRITRIVFYVAKSNEGNSRLIAGEKFTDPFWKSFSLSMEAVGETQAKIKIEKV